MPTKRHIIVCEGESERAYLQRLQAFLDKQELPAGTFEPPLIFIGPQYSVAKTGSFGKIKSAYKKTRIANQGSRSIQIWVDFDLYHRNDRRCAEYYMAKTGGIPDFLFSFHNFEDFFALHFDGLALEEWVRFGGVTGHFTTPLHSEGYLPEIERIFPGYDKGRLPTDFVSWDSLKNLKANLARQPDSNPGNIQNIRSFAEFLIREIGDAYPGFLEANPSSPAP